MQELSVKNLTKRVALWGPPSSGKTWLLKAFQQAMSICDVRDKNFHYVLQSMREEQLNQNVFFHSATSHRQEEDVVDYFWKVYRYPKLSKPEKQHFVSSHAHYLLIHELDGNAAINLAQSVKTVLKESNFVFIFLDPTLLLDDSLDKSDFDEKTIERPQEINDPDDGGINLDLLFAQSPKPVEENRNRTGEKTDNTSPEKLTKEQYFTYVKDVLGFLFRQVRSPSIVLCITKVDQFKLGTNPESLLGQLFGKEMAKLVNKYLQTSNGTVTLKSLSSFGYLGAQEPNYDLRTGRIKSVADWVPYMVEHPFFEYLENEERKKIEFANEWIYRLLFARESLSLLLPYIRLDRH